MSNAALALQFAKELATQLITIASALIGVSVTFVKDFTPQGKGWLRASWLLYIVSILFGIVALMALTGMIEALAANGASFTSFSFPTRWASGAQILLFLGGTVCLVIFGWLHNLQRAPTPPPPVEAPPQSRAMSAVANGEGNVGG